VNTHVTAILHFLFFIGSTFFRKGENIQLRHTHQVLFKVLNSESFADEKDKSRFSQMFTIGCLMTQMFIETVRWIRSWTGFRKRTFLHNWLHLQHPNGRVKYQTWKVVTKLPKISHKVISTSVPMMMRFSALFFFFFWNNFRSSPKWNWRLLCVFFWFSWRTRKHKQVVDIS